MLVFREPLKTVQCRGQVFLPCGSAERWRCIRSAFCCERSQSQSHRQETLPRGN